MTNKFLIKIALKLSGEAKDYARKMISGARLKSKPVKPSKLMNVFMKPSQRGSYGNEMMRARNVAARVTRNEGKPMAMKKAAGKNY